MPKSLIRQAVSADFRALLEIDRSSFEPGVAYDSAELSYFTRRPGAATLVAEVDNKIVAFVLLELHRRKGLAVVVTLDVLVPHRRIGIGSQLLAAAEEMLRNNEIGRLELQVDVTNASALAFYERHGFAIERLLERYYANGNDAYLMVKTIT